MRANYSIEIAAMSTAGTGSVRIVPARRPDEASAPRRTRGDGQVRKPGGPVAVPRRTTSSTPSSSQESPSQTCADAHHHPAIDPEPACGEVTLRRDACGEEVDDPVNSPELLGIPTVSLRKTSQAGNGPYGEPRDHLDEDPRASDPARPGVAGVGPGQSVPTGSSPSSSRSSRAKSSASSKPL